MFPHTLRLNRAAIAASLAIGLTVAISSFSVVRAEYAKVYNNVSYTCSSGTACVESNASGNKTWAIYGTGTQDTAITGSTNTGNGNSGVAGISTGIYEGTGHGVYGRSANGQGVYGTSSAGGPTSVGNGVEGHSTANGGSGIAGYQLNTSSNGGNGAYGESADTTGNFATLMGRGDKAQTYLLTVYDAAKDDASCYIDPSADLVCSGSISGNSIRTQHTIGSGHNVLAYAAESATATLEDVGTARMIGGVASVAIDRAFGSTIDRSAYHVFLTPDGDASLYVAQKTQAGFVVRETHGGRSTLDFDYRIIARPIDAKGDRLPPAPAPRHFGKTR